MWLFFTFADHLRWIGAVLKKFFSLVPVPTLAVVVLTLVSQFAKLLAFFLPLKVIILLGSPSMPRYFPEAWAAFDRDALVLLLSFATLLFFLLYLMAEKILISMAKQGAAGVIARSLKLVLFSNQDEIASQAYQKLAASLATCVLFAVLFLLFAILYPAFLGIILAYVLAGPTLVSLITNKQGELRSRLREKARGVIELTSGLGFLLLFAFIVANFLLGEGVSFMVAIICLLLSRQLFNRMESAFKDALWLHDKRLQINAIFFTGHQLEKEPENHRHLKLLGLLALVERPERLVPLLERISGFPLTSDSTLICRWKQSGLIDILVFNVELRVPDREVQYILLKVFGSRHKKAALNEADLLLSTSGQALPTLELLGVDQLDGFDVHLFRSPVEVKASRDDAVNQLAERTVRCWQVEPDKNLVNRYCRSHPFLYQRLTPRMLARLGAISTEAIHRDQIVQLSNSFEGLLAELGKLPLAVINSSSPRELTFVTTSGELQLAHWGNWNLEPVGACLTQRLRREERLKEMIEKAAEQREALKAVPLERILLSANCFAFEEAFSKQRYADAIALIPDLLSCLSNLRKATHYNDSKISNSSLDNS